MNNRRQFIATVVEKQKDRQYMAIVGWMVFALIIVDILMSSIGW